MGFFGGPRRSTVQDLVFRSLEPSPVDVSAEDAAGSAAGAAPQDAAGVADPTIESGRIADPWVIGRAAEEPGRSVDVDVIGNGYQVSGRLGIGRFDRLSDWLNMQQGWIQVEDGVLFHPGHEKPDDARQRSSQWMRLDHVVLVCEKLRLPVSRTSPLQVQKARRRVTIVTPGYTLRGYVHLHEDGSMQQFLESPDPHFIPMTDVVVRSLADETVVSHEPFALVNRAELISVSEEPVRAEADAPEAVEHADDAPETEFEYLRQSA